MSRNNIRNRFANGDQLIATNAWDGLSAKIAEKLGFDMVVLVSGPLNLTWGVRDAVLTPSQVVDITRRIADVVKIPVCVDMERGYGSVREAAYWTSQLEKAGASMVFLTDFPQLANPALYAIGRQSTLLSLSNIRDRALLEEKSKTMLAVPEDHAEIIKAICGARGEMLVGIRTWAAAITGVDDAIRRLKIYRDAGADIMFAHYPKDKETLRQYNRELSKPLMVLMNPPDFSPELMGSYIANASFDELKAESVQLVVVTNLDRVAYGAQFNGLSEVMKSRNVKCLEGKMLDKKIASQLLE